MSEEHSPHDTSALDEDEARKAEAARQKRDREVDDFKWLLAHRQGRRVMWRLLGITGVFRTPFRPGRDGSTEFNAGAQNVGQQLLTEIHELCPEQYHVMVKEQQENARRTDKRSTDT